MRQAGGQMKFHQRMATWFSSLSRWAIRHPKAALVIAAVVTLSAAPGMARLKLRTDGHALVTADAPEVLFDSAIREKFGIEDQIVVLIHAAQHDGVFNPATLQRARRLTSQCPKLPGIKPWSVMS